MRQSLLYSLLELAHATSQNLGFAHSKGVYVSYGEETITETNLLELRRRHPAMIRLMTFGKKQEALNGADWEWHIIGRARKLRMRVQAKRLQKDNKIKIPHEVASSKKQQIDLLITDAKIHKLKPIYCIYSSEIQRSIWRTKLPSQESKEFEYGCLLASAHRVRSIMPKTLSAIEADCVPWHYLVERQRYSERFLSWPQDTTLSFVNAEGARPILREGDDSAASLNTFPTLDELNAIDGPKIELEGVVEVESSDYQLSVPDGHYLERGISRLIEIDVRDIPLRRRPGV